MKSVKHRAFLMPTSIADSKNLLSDLMARYRNQVDYLAIRLEEAEGTDILLRGEKLRPSAKESQLVVKSELVTKAAGALPVLTDFPPSPKESKKPSRRLNSLAKKKRFWHL